MTARNTHDQIDRERLTGVRMKLLVSRLLALDLVDPAQLVGLKLEGKGGVVQLGMTPAFAYNFGLALIDKIMSSPIAQRAALPTAPSRPHFEAQATPSGVHFAVTQDGGGMLVDTTMDWDTAEKLRDRLTSVLAERPAPPSLN